MDVNNAGFKRKKKTSKEMHSVSQKTQYVLVRSDSGLFSGLNMPFTD